MAPIAKAAPSPATAPARVLRRSLRRIASVAVCSQSRLIRLTANKRGGRLLCRPRRLERITYFRLVIAVRSAESFAMPAAPHQFEPNAVAPLPGLIAVTKPGLELVVL